MVTETNLDMSFDRPVIMLKQMKNIRALIDTGARFPVWIKDESLLKEVFNAKLLYSNASFTGFGGESFGNIYSLPSFSITEQFFFPNMPIIASRLESMEEISVIIPATCFRGTNYCFNEELAMLQISVLDGQPSRRMKLIDEKGELQVLTN